ncbi:MAG: TetR/AcrR family transcriptional regulator [Deltaproteobacteria bacterium]|nr:TetR/AcrR family transcriptional regulator [Deltaproteobacteria bacterium]
MARPSRKAEGRLEILEAAAGVLAKHGFHGMSMRDLAKALGKTPAGFYNYYESKEDLLADLQQRAFETLVQSAAAAVAQGVSPVDKLYAFIQQHVQYVARNHAIMQVLIQEAHALPPKQRAAVRAVKERYYAIGRDVVAAVLEEASCTPRKGGAKRAPVDPLELERQTYALFGMINWTYGWYRPAVHGTPQVLAHTLHRLLLCGLRPACAMHDTNADVTATVERLAEKKPLPLLQLVKAPGESA